MPFRSSNAYYAADVAALVGGVVAASPEAVIGTLVTNSSTRSSFSVEPAQRDAWLQQITVLQSALVGVAGTVFLEFLPGVPSWSSLYPASAADLTSR
jgi:hypothetical protein